MTGLERLSWQLGLVHRDPLSCFVRNALYAKAPLFLPTGFHATRERVKFQYSRRKPLDAAVKRV